MLNPELIANSGHVFWIASYRGLMGGGSRSPVHYKRANTARTLCNKEIPPYCGAVFKPLTVDCPECKAILAAGNVYSK